MKIHRRNNTGQWIHFRVANVNGCTLGLHGCISIMVFKNQQDGVVFVSLCKESSLNAFTRAQLEAVATPGESIRRPLFVRNISSPRLARYVSEVW